MSQCHVYHPQVIYWERHAISWIASGQLGHHARTGQLSYVHARTVVHTCLQEPGHNMSDCGHIGLSQDCCVSRQNRQPCVSQCIAAWFHSGTGAWVDPGQLLCTAALCSALGPPALRLGYIGDIWDAPAELFGVLRLVAAFWAPQSDLCWLLRGPPWLPADLLGGCCVVTALVTFCSGRGWKLLGLPGLPADLPGGWVVTALVTFCLWPGWPTTWTSLPSCGLAWWLLSGDSLVTFCCYSIA